MSHTMAEEQARNLIGSCKIAGGFTPLNIVCLVCIMKRLSSSTALTTSITYCPEIMDTNRQSTRTS